MTCNKAMKALLQIRQAITLTCFQRFQDIAVGLKFDRDMIEI